MAAIKKRGNSYSIRVSCGYDMQGKQIIKSMTWKPEKGMTVKQIEKEVQRQAVLFEDKCKKGLYLDGSIRFAGFAEKWLTDYAEKQLKAVTIYRLKYMLQQINQSIGHIPLEKLQPIHIIRFYDNLAEEGIKHTTAYVVKIDLKALLKEKGYTYQHLANLSGTSICTIQNICNCHNVYHKTAQKVADALEYPIENLFTRQLKQSKLKSSTIRAYHIAISSVLSTAVHWQIITSNPCQRVKPPKIDTKESKYIDEKQALYMLECLSNELLQNRTLITLLVYTGMRRGEILGLKWSDIDFHNNTITIQRELLYTPDKGLFEDTPKTTTSNRIIKVAEAPLKLLKKHKAEQTIRRLQCGDLWHNNNYVFSTWNGRPLNISSVNLWFKKFLERYDLPLITLHSLRHTNASLLIANGVNITTVSKRLGHANTAITASICRYGVSIL
ncbi:site-specific integrase [Clostridium sp. MD294]|uniref:site-specific integrase n=1 Tax=Clostridium sp. MD294 TaxID=97138 RepID=UPI0002C8D3D4|nr:site-specific integrase [Clostridium sp. MD294]NDO45505.1 site-specific integrase [Clostridium sp. MD294]USF30843.1 Tyrosine recombinase XerC [Clostridium sp. MD294]